jgi:ferredoxin-type protein NapG
MADHHKDKPDESELLSRKSFIQQGLRAMVEQVAQVIPDFSGQQETVLSARLRPPGAIAEKQFYGVCEPFCNECRNVCPRDAISHDEFGFPFIQPETSPCVMCLDVPCTRACPTGALALLTDPHQISMGTAVIELTACTAYHGSGCHECYTACPIQNEAIVLNEGLPQVVPDQCTGCGACVFYCPTPGAITIHTYC